MKKDALQRLMDQLTGGQQGAEETATSFSASDIPNEKNDISVTVKFAEHVLSALPEEIAMENGEKAFDGNLAVIAVLDRDGKVHSGIVGSMRTPVDSLILCEALQKLQSDLAIRGVEFIKENM